MKRSRVGEVATKASSSDERTIVREGVDHSQGHLQGVLAVQVDDSAATWHKLLVVLVKELHQVTP